MEANKKEANSCIAEWHGEMKFQVRCMQGDQYTVNLDDRSCSCNKWDLCGIPCPHGIAAIQDRGHEPEEYVHDCYKREAYVRAYHPLIQPINGQKMWPKSGFTPVLPPIGRRQPGRPKKLRNKGPEEYINPEKPHKLRKVGQEILCSNCGKTGHSSCVCFEELATLFVWREI